MILEKTLPLPDLGVGIDSGDNLVIFISDKQVTPALAASVTSSFVAEGRQHVGKFIKFQEVVEQLNLSVQRNFVTAVMQGRYVRDPLTKIWDVTLN